MSEADALLWFVLAFTDGSDCLLQGSFHSTIDEQTFSREDGCAVQSRQEGNYVVFWSRDRWVAIKIPAGAKSLSYRWGRTAAHINGNSVIVQYGTTLNTSPIGTPRSERDQAGRISEWSTRRAQPERTTGLVDRL